MRISRAAIVFSSICVAIATTAALSSCGSSTTSGLSNAIGGDALPSSSSLCAWSTPVVRNDGYSQQFHAVTFASTAAGVQVVPNGNSSIAACDYFPAYTPNGMGAGISFGFTLSMMTASAGYDAAKSTGQSGGQFTKDSHDGFDIYTSSSDEWVELGANEYLSTDMLATIGDQTVTQQEVGGFMHDTMYGLLDQWKSGKRPSSQSAGSSSSSPAAEAAPKVCPLAVISFIEGQYGPSQSQNLSVIDASLGVSLPAGALCVLTVAGDTANSTAYYIYWPNQGQAFADSVAQIMTAHGYATDDARIGTTEKSGQDAYVTAYPSDCTFGSADYVEISGQFDGVPGK